MSSFCADTSDGELVISLTRKMSSDGHIRSTVVKSIEDTQIELKQKQIQKEFNPVIDLFKENCFTPKDLLKDDP